MVNFSQIGTAKNVYFSAKILTIAFLLDFQQVTKNPI